MCREIAEGRSMNVLEFDAASNTQVDKIREIIIENVKYAPVGGRYKVYIVDEVHMLSTASFNALLKTLEEPPPHVIFVFATTDVQKVPTTILSRCQRFDLKAHPNRPHSRSPSLHR
jgi:DNA polymerase-3 subunit gamma/tau